MSCPTCNRPVQWNSDSPWRPFCSERCKLIDLGAWASERHVIAGEQQLMDAEEAGDTERSTVQNDEKQI